MDVFEGVEAPNEMILAMSLYAPGTPAGNSLKKLSPVYTK